MCWSPYFFYLHLVARQQTTYSKAAHLLLKYLAETVRAHALLVGQQNFVWTSVLFILIASLIE